MRVIFTSRLFYRLLSLYQTLIVTFLTQSHRFAYLFLRVTGKPQDKPFSGDAVMPFYAKARVDINMSYISLKLPTVEIST